MSEIKLKVSPEWDDTRTFNEICSQSKFSYLCKLKGKDKLAPGDYGKPHLVTEQTEKGLVFTQIEAFGGAFVDGDGIAGHGFVSEINKSFDLCIYLDAKECVKVYFELCGLDEYILK